MFLFSKFNVFYMLRVFQNKKTENQRFSLCFPSSKQKTVFKNRKQTVPNNNALCVSNIILNNSFQIYEPNSSVLNFHISLTSLLNPNRPFLYSFFFRPLFLVSMDDFFFLFLT